MKRFLILGAVACASMGAGISGAQAQSLESLFVMCRAGYTYDAAKNMCMLDKKAKKTSKKKVAKKAKKAKA
ncbi:MAG TPA: hypothetical protein VF051_05025 [Hyphomicrobiaceae bacterium]|jgi:hypothetical protein